MADREGYILLDRNILNWQWWHKHNTLIVFLWLLMKAQFHESYFQGVKIERGQIATTIANIQQPCKMTRQEVKTAISNLKSTNAINITRHSKFLVITIVNYEEYQSLNINSNIKQTSRKHHVNINQPYTNTYNTYNTGENRNNNRSAPVQPYPCGVAEKPGWMTDAEWDNCKMKTTDDIPVVDRGYYDTYIEYAEAEHRGETA